MKQFSAELGALKGAGPRGDRRARQGQRLWARRRAEAGDRAGSQVLRAPGLFTGSSMLGVGGGEGGGREADSSWGTGVG